MKLPTDGYLLVITICMAVAYRLLMTIIDVGLCLTPIKKYINVFLINLLFHKNHNQYKSYTDLLTACTRIECLWVADRH